MNVPLRFIRLREAVSLIKAVGIAATQGTESDGHVMGVGVVEYVQQDCCAKTLTLMLRQDVEMIQTPVIFFWTNQHEACRYPVHLDEPA